MDILDKFSSVEVKADDRISAADREYCVRQQSAYEKSGAFLRELAVDLGEAWEEQQELLHTDESDYSDGFMSREHLSVQHVNDLLISRHKTLIKRIVSYFSKTYTVDLDHERIYKHLMPQEPKYSPQYFHLESPLTEEQRRSNRAYLDAFQEDMKAYKNEIDTLNLQYQDIVNEIFAQLGGFSFSEQAFRELVSACRDAVYHRIYQVSEDAADFEVKKDTLQITRCSCRFYSGWNTPRWQITDGAKHILDAVAHFEYGKFGYGFCAFPALYSWQIEMNYFEFPNMEKLRSVKLFKNGRVDIRFSSAMAANEFVNTYLKGSA